MKFASTTIGSLAVRVLLIRPDWNPSKGRPITITHKLDTQVDEGRTTIEERRPQRAALLLTQKCTLLIAANEADDWRKGLAALGPEPVAMPLWIDALPVALWSTRIYDPQKVINFDDSGNFAIYDGGSLPGSPAYPYYAPLLIGRWSGGKRPAVNALTNKIGEVAIELAEASPYSCRIAINSYGSSWTAAPDWNSPPKDTSDYGLEFLTKSAAREPALDRINAAARWLQDAGFTFASRLDIRTALSWFVAKRGSWQSWSPLPAWFQPGADTSGTPSNYTARFADDSLTLDYPAPNLATARIGFVQEIDTGARAQNLAAQKYLLRLSYAQDTGNPELFTTYDAPLTIGGATFNPAQIEVKQLRLSLKPQDEKAEVAIPFVTGSLCDDWKKGRLYGPLMLTVWPINPDSLPGSLPAPIFSGQVTNVMAEGTMHTVEASLFGPLLSARVPSWAYGERCKVHVFSTLCGLTAATFQSTGTIARANLAADRVTLTIPGASGWGDGGGYADNWFANGTLYTGTGRLTIIALIVASATVSGNLTLTLSRPLWADMLDVTSQAVTLEPGCSGQYDSDCGTKFSNQVNFRGEPFMPDALATVNPGQPNTPKK